ncbi:uncharacterized protein Z520_09246 [Fonsecaea multimorphosa CBS 102226]|uniref:Short-chain dehydrogenase n=1 Tax=Fonsecaea multimorphosa CBS 102226 TaxID=1442371 RepID=A0A0D2ICV7_9EURO|nr:uncharacterized protein Z520_09246 [Fonsecaea multimorphosa CBS 102226]KIX94936.1 hypothetical protein Z520_09246 [Fonsecaea multimorphosa CBS 102226]OAL20587.1 hypothetical protein AYO22_08596 [Fonsecaea multimorphosa]
MNNWFQFFKESWPPRPEFTDKELGDQTGKVFIITGTTSGVGKALTGILYSKNATVYTAARNQERALEVNADIKTQNPESTGKLIYLKMDLEDLGSVKAAAQEFLSKESRLDVLWNNAAVLMPPAGSKTKQGLDLQLGVNCLAPFLFTKLLTPTMLATAKISPPGSVRVMFVGSSATYLFAPTGGVEMLRLRDASEKDPTYMYGVSKAANALYALHFAKLHREDGIIAVSGNPGNLRSDLPRHVSRWGQILMRALQYDPVYGAYTELFGGLSPKITLEKTGAWLMPWGRIGKLRPDIEEAGKSKADGGSGIAEELWAWSEEHVRYYV